MDSGTTWQGKTHGQGIAFLSSLAVINDIMAKEVEREPTKYAIPAWCADKCINVGTIACEYECASERQARFFVADPELTLKDISPFPSHDWTWNMSPQERQACAGLYLEKTVEAITGVPQKPDDEKRKRLKMESVAQEDTWKLLGEIAMCEVKKE